MLSRMMYKPHISCLQKDIVTQNGITLTTDSEINKILLNGAEVYCIDTSKCYLYDEENKTLIEKSEINDILVDGEITPESVTLINNKVNNFIAEINDKIAQADIDKVVELANELDVLTGDISEINSSLNAKANKTNAEFEGNMKLNNVDVATNITSDIILQNGWVKLEDTAALKLCKTGKQISAILHIKGGVIAGGTVICNLGCAFDHYQNFIAYRYDGLILGTVTLNKNGDVNVTTLSSNEDVFIVINDICE